MLCLPLTTMHVCVAYAVRDVCACMHVPVLTCPLRACTCVCVCVCACVCTDSSGKTQTYPSICEAECEGTDAADTHLMLLHTACVRVCLFACVPGPGQCMHTQNACPKGGAHCGWVDTHACTRTTHPRTPRVYINGVDARTPTQPPLFVYVTIVTRCRTSSAPSFIPYQQQPPSPSTHMPVHT